MVRPSKLNQEVQQRIGDNIALGLTYRLAAEAGNCQICMWILERRFSEEFGRRVYRKTNVISENKNANVELIINDTDAIRNKILDKLSMVGEL